MITGSELISYEHFTESHQLRDSNTPMLTAAVTEAGGEIVNSVHVKDDASLIRLILESAVNNSDLIISSGGVSMGNHDHVREMAVKAGFKELAWMINQKPGKPMFLAKKEETLLLALPGNPVSAYICFKHYLRPLIQSMQGKSFSWPTMNAHVSEIIENKSGRTHLMRVNLKHQEQEFIVFPLARQGSHMISSIAAADGYIILPGGSKFSKGELLEVFLF
jgi:molybdopterin molybdotransferase